MMKKILVLALCLAVSFVLAACGTKEPQTATVAFDANPSTGYQWTFEQDDEVFDITDEYVQAEGTEGLTGAGGTDTFTLTPLKEGKVAVTFKYARSWEDEDADTYTYNFEVDKDMQISFEGAGASVAGDMSEVPELPDPVIE